MTEVLLFVLAAVAGFLIHFVVRALRLVRKEKRLASSMARDTDKVGRELLKGGDPLSGFFGLVTLLFVLPAVLAAGVGILASIALLGVIALMLVGGATLGGFAILNTQDIPALVAVALVLGGLATGAVVYQVVRALVIRRMDRSHG